MIGFLPHFFKFCIAKVFLFFKLQKHKNYAKEKQIIDFFQLLSYFYYYFIYYQPIKKYRLYVFCAKIVYLFHGFPERGSM